jgi:hypothetical protein
MRKRHRPSIVVLDHPDQPGDVRLTPLGGYGWEKTDERSVQKSGPSYVERLDEDSVADSESWGEGVLDFLPGLGRKSDFFLKEVSDESEGDTDSEDYPDVEGSVEEDDEEEEDSRDTRPYHAIYGVVDQEESDSASSDNDDVRWLRKRRRLKQIPKPEGFWDAEKKIARLGGKSQEHDLLLALEYEIYNDIYYRLKNVDLTEAYEIVDDEDLENQIWQLGLGNHCWWVQELETDVVRQHPDDAFLLFFDCMNVETIGKIFGPEDQYRYYNIAKLAFERKKWKVLQKLATTGVIDVLRELLYESWGPVNPKEVYELTINPRVSIRNIRMNMIKSPTLKAAFKRGLLERKARLATSQIRKKVKGKKEQDKEKALPNQPLLLRDRLLAMGEKQLASGDGADGEDSDDSFFEPVLDIASWRLILLRAKISELCDVLGDILIIEPVAPLTLQILQDVIQDLVKDIADIMRIPKNVIDNIKESELCQFFIDVFKMGPEYTDEIHQRVIERKTLRENMGKLMKSIEDMERLNITIPPELKQSLMKLQELYLGVYE